MLSTMLLALQAMAAAAPAPAGKAPVILPSPPPAPRLAAPRQSYAEILAAVRREFPLYDERHQGRLGPLEFGTWVMHANGAEVRPADAGAGARGVKPVTAMNATARAFSQADLNHDGGVTPDEMARFLMR